MKGRFKSFDFWDGAVFGATIATILGLTIAWLFTESSQEHWAALATLVAIPVAGVGALIALWSTRYQIRQTRDQDLEAARAVLPLALSSAIGAAKNGMAYASGQKVATRMEVEEALALGERVIEVLRDCVRSSDPVTREWLQVLIRRYQVYYSRIDWWCEQSPPILVNGTLLLSTERQDAIMDWATLYAIIEHFYPFSRGTVKSVSRNLLAERLRSAYNLHLIDLPFDDVFVDRIDLRIERLSDGRIEHFQFQS